MQIVVDQSCAKSGSNVATPLIPYTDHGRSLVSGYINFTTIRKPLKINKEKDSSNY